MGLWGTLGARHENVHKENGVSAGKEIYALLNFLNEDDIYRSCPELEKTAWQVVTECKQKYWKKDADYDERWNHGYEQNIHLTN